MASTSFNLTLAAGGSKTSAAVTIPDTATDGEVLLTGAACTDPAFRASVSIDFSPDGGAAWASTAPSAATGPFPVTATFEGGSVDKHGNPVTAFGVGATFPPGVGRKVRGTIIVDGVAFSGTVAANTTP